MNLLSKAKLVVAAMVIAAQMATAAFAVDGGIEWEVAGGTLTIRKGSGTGAMNSYDETGTGRAPWIIAGMTGVTTLDIQSGVTSIGSSAFRNCSGFTGTLTIPARVTSIGIYAFEYCSGFTGALNIPEGVTSIGAYAFRNCSGFTGTLTIPAGVTSIAAYAFAGCSGFTGALTIPSSVTSIGDNAFQNCTGLTSLTTPNSVTSIGTYAFYGCTGLTSVTIPSSVTTIGGSAFFQCSGLNRVINLATTPQTIDNSVFNYAPLSNVKLYVPAEGLEEYKGADIWIKFGTKIGLVSIPTAANTSFVYDASEHNIDIEENAAYTVSGVVKGTDAGTYTSTVALTDKETYLWYDFTDDDITVEWSIAKAQIAKPAVTGNLVYTAIEQTAGIAANAAYTVTGNKGTNAKADYSATVVLKDKANYEWTGGGNADLVLVWSIAKATPTYTTPTGLKAKVGQALSAVTLPSGWSWMTPANLVGDVGNRTHKAKFTPTDAANYNVVENIDITIAVEAATTPIIKDIQKSDGRVGIRLVSGNVVSEKADMQIILPNDKVSQVKVVIYDNIGNVVSEKTQNSANVSWDLTNSAGRFVANGTYLIVAEVTGANKKVYAYSAKLGVKR